MGELADPAAEDTMTQHDALTYVIEAIEIIAAQLPAPPSKDTAGG